MSDHNQIHSSHIKYFIVMFLWTYRVKYYVIIFAIEVSIQTFTNSFILDP